MPALLDNISLYSVIVGKRIHYIPDSYNISFRQRMIYKLYNSKLRHLTSFLLPKKVKNYIKKKLL